jgi:hypothetical protein
MTEKIIQMTPEEYEEGMLYLDFEYYANTYMFIQDKDGELVIFEFNTAQRALHAIIEDLYKRGAPVLIIILKARQMGISTYMNGRNYWNATRDKNTHCVTVSHEPQATDKLFAMIKRFHSHLPEDERPETRYNNLQKIDFNKKDGSAGGLDSSVSVGTAGKSDFGSGQTITHLHLSELAKWARHIEKDLLTSLFQAVAFKNPAASVVIESTARGVGGEYYDRFYSARYVYMASLKDGKILIKLTINEAEDEENAFCSVFFPWFIFPEYQIEPGPDFERTDEETEIVALHGVTDAQLKWRRWAIINRCGKDKEKFRQEYPASPEEAFLGSGRPVFDLYQCQALKKALEVRRPIATYEHNASYDWVAEKGGRLEVYEEPRSGIPYLISCDVAEGLIHGDMTTFSVLNHYTGDQVAHWCGSIDPLELADLLASLGYRYNTALLAPERNNHGIATVTRLATKLDYPNIYAEMVDEPPSKPRKRYGWLTSSKNRSHIIATLKKLFNDGEHGIRSWRTVEEMMYFIYNDKGRPEGQSGKRDDQVMEYAIGQHVRLMTQPVTPETRRGSGSPRREAPVATSAAAAATSRRKWAARQ